MDMKPVSSSPRANVVVATSQTRQTPTSGATVFKDVLARSVVRSAEVAMHTLPGGPLMAVALRGGGGPLPAAAVPFGGPGVPLRGGTAEGPGVSPRGLGQVVGSPLATGGAALAGGAGAGQSDAAGIESSLAQSQEMNLYYLQIQETVNAQNRSFTALSNVLKAEHDTVKTAIGNIR